MLHCLYHPIDPMRVVNDEDRKELVASGFWFDSPTKAQEFRAEVEKDIAKKVEKSEKQASPKGRAKKEKTDA